MIINRGSLLDAAPIKNMLVAKHTANGVSHGLSEAGYDIRIKQTVIFKPNGWRLGDDRPHVSTKWFEDDGQKYGDAHLGRFVLASAMEEFDMPHFLVGVVHDKSTWARRGLSLFNTVIEPGWKGFLTLELVYHGNEDLIIPAGSGIAQVVFSEVSDEVAYDGKYQNQENKPVQAREA